MKVLVSLEIEKALSMASSRARASMGILLSLALGLAGCDQQAMFEKFVPQDEAAVAKQVLSQLAAKDFVAIESQLDQALQSPSVRSSLEQAAAAFPSQAPTRIATVGSNTSTLNSVTTYNLTFEHEYPDRWLLTNVVLERHGSTLRVIGLHVRQMNQSLEEANRFTFEGKSALHYLVFALAILEPLFIVYALVLCFRTPILRRKWLWLLFVAVGLVRFSLNWSDGAHDIQFLNISLLGAGFVRPGPVAPYIFNVSLPIGAIVFLARRRSFFAAPWPPKPAA